LRLVPVVDADERAGKVDTVGIGRLGVGHDGAPCGHGLGRLVGADQAFGEAALQVDPVGLGRERALEIGHGLGRVGGLDHDVVEAAFVDDVEFLERAVDLSRAPVSARAARPSIAARTARPAPTTTRRGRHRPNDRTIL